MLRYTVIIIAAICFASCKQQAGEKTMGASGENLTSEIPDKTMSDSAKVALINISDIAWLQVQAAEVALRKSHDTSILSFAQTISKQYTRIKDKAKIVSVPYRLNMPYFLTHDQNEQIGKLKAADEASFDKTFLNQIQNTDLELLNKCVLLESLTNDDTAIFQFLSFSKSVIDETEKKLQEIM